MRVVRFAITNFRSLRDFEISGLASVNVLHGENDVGKSNVLAALQMIFDAKWRRTAADYTPGWFHEGEARRFGNNFFNNRTDPITFTVYLSFDAVEIAKDLSRGKTRPNATKLASAPLSISGVISEPRILPSPPVGAFLRERRRPPATPQETVADFRVTRMEWHNIAVYDGDAKGDTILPGQANGFFGVQPEQYAEFFGLLAVYLTDSFQLVPPTRFYGPERARQTDTSLHPGNLKNALLQWSQGLPDAGRIQTFHDIQRWFDGKPFSYGQVNPYVIPLGPQDSMVDIMVTRGALGLPIDRYGTGVQQILILLTYLLSDRKRRMLGVEEMELNLSPGTQDRILDQLRSAMEVPAFQLDQLFLTSHSEVFATKCRGRSYMLRMREGHTEVTPAKEARAEMTAHFLPSKSDCERCSARALTPKGRKYAGAPVDWKSTDDLGDAEFADIQAECYPRFCKDCDGKLDTAKRLAEKQGLKLPW